MPEDVGRDAALVAAAGAGAAAGFLVAGPANPLVVAAASQASVAAMSRTWDTVTAARRNRATIPFEYAARATGSSIDELNEVLISDPNRLRLTTAVIDAAMDAGLDEKLLELGRILQDAVRDDAKLDLDALIVDALSIVEAPHLKVLSKFGAQPLTVQEEWFPELGVGSTAILRALSGKGLLREVIEYREMQGISRFPGVVDAQPQQVQYRRWQLTNFGEEVMGRLRSAAEELRGNVS